MMSGAPMLSIHPAHVNWGRLGGGVKPPNIAMLNFCRPCARNISAATTRSTKKKKSEYGPSSRFIWSSGYLTFNRLYGLCGHLNLNLSAQKSIVLSVYCVDVDGNAPHNIAER